MAGSYDDQHYLERNPDSLAYQDPAEVMFTVWAALRPCREITGKDFGREENRWIEWVEPKKWNPDCGLRVFEAGRFFGRREFAQVALNIIGDDYEISVWRKRHEGVQVFSTRDEGPILAPEARLEAAVSQMLELTTMFDSWSREQSLRTNFPKEWLGTSWKQVAKQYFLSKAKAAAAAVWDRIDEKVNEKGWPKPLAYFYGVIAEVGIALFALFFVAIGLFLLPGSPDRIGREWEENKSEILSPFTFAEGIPSLDDLTPAIEFAITCCLPFLFVAFVIAGLYAAARSVIALLLMRRFRRNL